MACAGSEESQGRQTEYPADDAYSSLKRRERGIRPVCDEVDELYEGASLLFIVASRSNRG